METTDYVNILLNILGVLVPGGVGAVVVVAMSKINLGFKEFKMELLEELVKAVEVKLQPKFDQITNRQDDERKRLTEVEARLSKLESSVNNVGRFRSSDFEDIAQRAATVAAGLSQRSGLSKE